MIFEHPQFLWLLLVFPPTLLAFFWWAMRSRQKLLVQFIEARLLSQLTVGISPAAENPVWLLARSGIACCPWPGRSTDLTCRKSSSAD